MPNFDGTGPFGDGRPGRGYGPCGRGDYPRSVPDRGRGVNPNYGYPRRRRFFDYFLPFAEDVRDIFRSKASLRERKSQLEQELSLVNQELKESEQDRD